MALIKTEILTSCEVSYTKSCMRNHFLFYKKDAFKCSFFSLKLLAQAKKKWHSIFVKSLQVSADKGMGK